MASSEQTDTKVVSTGIGLPTILFLIFLVLRLTDQIDWAWYWVASPLIIGWGFTALCIIAMIIIAALAG